MTHALLLAAALLNPGTPTDRFAVRIELQALYDEISQATLQFVTESDIDEFHAVLYTQDWAIVDAKGQRRTWAELREHEVATLKESPAD